jgi:hypothetical protein
MKLGLSGKALNIQLFDFVCVCVLFFHCQFPNRGPGPEMKCSHYFSVRSRELEILPAIVGKRRDEKCVHMRVVSEQLGEGSGLTSGGSYIFMSRTGIGHSSQSMLGHFPGCLVTRQSF